MRSAITVLLAAAVLTPDVAMHQPVFRSRVDVVRIDGDNHLVLVRGAVPGPNGGLVMIRPTNKRG